MYSLISVSYDSVAQNVRKLSNLSFVLLLAPFILFHLSPPSNAFAVSPPPDGGYPGHNTAEGQDALLHLTNGQSNTAVGDEALKHDTSGSRNTAIGDDALRSGTTGFGNTAVGANALESNTIGGANTASGLEALVSNTIGNDNTATGSDTLFNNTTGSFNTGTGSGALNENTTGDFNTADGDDALLQNGTGSRSTAIGAAALLQSRGDNNIALGALAGVRLITGSNNIEIGNVGMAGDSGRIRIGTAGTHTNTFIAGISGVTVADGVNVIVNANGRLGTVTSSARYKDDIKPMDKASEAIYDLNPVSFHYKHELDPAGIPQFGLVAEAVEKVSPDLVARDEAGKPYTVRYEAVNAMLLNEFLKAHRTLQEQTAKFEAQQKQIEDLTAVVQKVREKLELKEPARDDVADR